MAPLLARKTVLLAKLHASASDPVPAVGANEIEIYDLDINPVFEKVQRKPLRASLSPLPMQKSKMLWELEFSTEAKGSGTRGTAGRLSALLQACGLVETASAGSSVFYKPGAPSKTVAFYVYRDGLLFKVLNAVGTGVLEVEAGKIPMIKWKFRGTYALPTDASLPTPVYETTIGPLAESTQTQISAYAGVIRKYTVDFGVDFLDRPSVNAAGAIEGVSISGRSPKITALMEAVLRATEDVLSEFDADTLIDFQSVLGGTSGNILTISASQKAQYSDLKITNENDILMYDIGLDLNGTDDEFMLNFT